MVIWRYPWGPLTCQTTHISIFCVAFCNIIVGEYTDLKFSTEVECSLWQTVLERDITMSLSRT